MGALAAVPLDAVRPKTVRRQYKKHPIVITYVPDAPKEERWTWKVVFTTVTEFSGKAMTTNAAAKAAEKYIDSVTK